MCTIYNIKDSKPKFKEVVVAYVTSLENNKTKVPVFAKLDRISEDENGIQYHWKERDTNAKIDLEVEYWTDYPVFNTSKICRDIKSV